MQIFLNGATIRTEADFHDAIDEAARKGGFNGYGRNLNALWDVLTGILSPPIEFQWFNFSKSQEAIGPRFDELLKVVKDAQRELGPSEFRLRLEP